MSTEKEMWKEKHLKYLFNTVPMPPIPMQYAARLPYAFYILLRKVLLRLLSRSGRIFPPSHYDVAKLLERLEVLYSYTP